MMATTVSKPSATGAGSVEDEVMVPKPTKHDIETVGGIIDLDVSSGSGGRAVLRDGWGGLAG